jgi:hypothetical protein
MASPSTPARTRDQRIDFWRGLCLFGMVSWHLLTHPSFPRWLAFAVIQPFNFVAEGFVLLAGAAVGLKIARKRSEPSGLLRRAGAMLLVHYALIAFVVGLATAERRLGLAVQVNPLPRSVWSVVDLSYQPYLADVLSVFVFLFAAAPIFQLVYERLGGWGVAVSSAVVFFTASVFPLNESGAFVFNSWQIFFVAGMLFGANYDTQMTRLKAGSRRWLYVWAAAFGVACVVRFVGGPDGSSLSGWHSYLGFNRKPLTVARVVYIGLEMVVIALFTVRWWETISDWFVVRRIVALGRHSLAVFVCSVMLDYVLKAACTALNVTFPANVLVWLIELTVLFVLADALGGSALGRPRPLRVGGSELAVN